MIAEMCVFTFWIYLDMDILETRFTCSIPSMYCLIALLWCTCTLTIKPIKSVCRIYFVIADRCSATCVDISFLYKFKRKWSQTRWIYASYSPKKKRKWKENERKMKIVNFVKNVHCWQLSYLASAQIEKNVNSVDTPEKFSIESSFFSIYF